jgi:hypothetical protein
MSPGSATHPGRKSRRECPEQSPSSTYGDSAHKRRSHNPGAASVINVVSAKRPLELRNVPAVGAVNTSVGSHQVYRSSTSRSGDPRATLQQQLPAVKITSVDNLFIQHRSSAFLTFWAQVRIVKMSVKTRLGRWFINIVRQSTSRLGVTTRHGIAAVGKIASVEFFQISVVNHFALGTSQQKVPRSGTAPTHRSLVVNQSRLGARIQKHSGRHP